VNPEFEKILAPLRSHAAHLNDLSRPSSTATVFYEVMSGGLVWTDEKITGVPTEVIWALRPLWAYRSSMISGAPAAKWQDYWNICLELFPNWIGFLPERMRPSPELLKILSYGKERLRKDLEASEQ
jgi:hypothetical protein